MCRLSTALILYLTATVTFILCYSRPTGVTILELTCVLHGREAVDYTRARKWGDVL